MVAGMGWLLGLCPQPEALTLAGLCEPFHILPSQVKTQDDWEFLAEVGALRNLQANYQAWNQGIESGDLKMPQDLIQWMLELTQEAEDKWTRRSQSS